MTKAQELAALAAFVGSLPPGSYLRVWLSAVTEIVAADIAADHFPSVSTADTRELCATLVHDAEKRAADLVSFAESRAASIVRDAEAKADGIRERMDRARLEFRRAISNL